MFRKLPSKKNILIKELKFKPYFSDYYDESLIFEFEGSIKNDSDFDIKDVSFNLITCNQFISKNSVSINLIPKHKKKDFFFTSSAYCTNYNTNKNQLRYYIDNLEFNFKHTKLWKLFNN